MDHSENRKSQLKAYLERNGSLLDERYIARGRELLAQYEKMQSKAESSPLFDEEEVNTDIKLAKKNSCVPKSTPRIIPYCLLVLGILSLLLPVEPFMSRAPICGVLVGLGGIFLFAGMLADRKHQARFEAYQDLLQKYGVTSWEDISRSQEQTSKLFVDMETVKSNLLKFAQYAYPKASSIADCKVVLDRFEDFIKEYRSL